MSVTITIMKGKTTDVPSVMDRSLYSAGTNGRVENLLDRINYCLRRLKWDQVTTSLDNDLLAVRGKAT